MTFSAILFYILAAIVLYGALRTVTAKNPVHAALHLVLTFCVSAMIWMLMQAEFLGITLVVVYVGAVMVLFLFVVMMLNIDIEEMRAGFWRHAPVAGVVGTLLAVALILILVNPKTDLAAFGLMKDIPADYNNIRDLGSRIYTEYLLPFELAAVLLLLGMVAAIALVHRKTTNPKRMDPADQVKVRADQGRMRLVKMEAVKLQVESAEESEVSDGLKMLKDSKMKKITFKPVLTAVAAAVALSACTMMPKYEQPQVAVADTFKYDTVDDGIRAAELGWQDYFADPRLHRLIDIALERNTDLRTAALNAEIYRKQYMIARNNLLPTVNASGTGSRQGSLSGGGGGRQ